MHVAELWRYPVKSMGGERMGDCDFGWDGIPGDRIVHVARSDGQVISSRRSPRLLLHRARLGEKGQPLVDDRPWQDPSVAADVRALAGEDARLVHWTGPERFDVLPLLVATDGAIAAMGYDRRRFRPNVVVGGVQGLAERRWVGRRLSIGAAEITAVELRRRCVMVTFDPDSGEQDVGVLRRIHHELDGTFALDCRVERPGAVHVGDAVRLLE
jgi:hypothetical protein